MTKGIENIMKKYYSEIYRKIGNGNGILICKKGKYELYIERIYGKIVFKTKSDINVIGINYNVFSDNDILLGIGFLNKYIIDINKKQEFFKSVFSLASA